MARRVRERLIVARGTPDIERRTLNAEGKKLLGPSLTDFFLVENERLAKGCFLATSFVPSDESHRFNGLGSTHLKPLKRTRTKPPTKRGWLTITFLGTLHLKSAMILFR